jgi:type I restriction enzyme, S subunit
MAADTKLTDYGRLSARFDCAPLGKLCLDRTGVQTGPFGSQLHEEDYVSVGTPILTVEHLSDNRISHSDLPRVSDADKLRLSRYSLQDGDIVFSRVGSVDRRALVRKE